MLHVALNLFVIINMINVPKCISAEMTKMYHSKFVELFLWLPQLLRLVISPQFGYVMRAALDRRHLRRTIASYTLYVQTHAAQSSVCSRRLMPSHACNSLICFGPSHLAEMILKFNSGVSFDFLRLPLPICAYGIAFMFVSSKIFRGGASPLVCRMLGS